MPFLSIQDFKFPIGEFSKCPVPDERRVRFDSYYLYIYFCYIPFVILDLFSFPR